MTKVVGPIALVPQTQTRPVVPGILGGLGSVDRDTVVRVLCHLVSRGSDDQVKVLKAELDGVQARIDEINEHRSELRARADDMIRASQILGTSTPSTEVTLLRTVLAEQIEAVEQEAALLRPDDLFARKAEIRRELERRERAARAVASIPGVR